MTQLGKDIIARARRVVYSQGKAENLLVQMTDAEVEKCAALMNMSGGLVPGVREKFRDFLIEFYDARKATTPESEAIEVQGEQTHTDGPREQT